MPAKKQTRRQPGQFIKDKDGNTSLAVAATRPAGSDAPKPAASKPTKAPKPDQAATAGTDKPETARTRS